MRSHRLSCLLARGPVPETLVVDHLCFRKRCVNPAHLEPVTLAENCRRARREGPHFHRKVECVRGHPLSGENLYITPRGSRRCRACKRLYDHNRVGFGRRRGHSRKRHNPNQGRLFE